MAGLSGRVDALEEIAEEVRRRPIRRMVDALARQHRLTTKETEDAFAQACETADRIEVERDRLLREGRSERDVMEIIAAQLGATADELEAECESVTRLYLGGAA